MAARELSIPVLVLAAGEGKRFGGTKQLAKVGDKSLVEIVLQVLQKSNLGPIFVALGHEREKIQSHIRERLRNQTDVHFILVPEWKLGMGYTLKSAIRKIIELDAGVKNTGIFITLGDQVLLSPDTFNKLKTRVLSTTQCDQATKTLAVACRYNSQEFGPPLWIHPQLFDDFLQIDNNSGAKQVLTKYLSRADLIQCEDASFDVDTAEDLESLKHLILKL